MQPALSTAASSGAPPARGARDTDFRGLVKGLLQFFSEEAREPEHAEDNTGKHAAGIVFVAPGGEVLLMERAATEKNYGGHWALPGGKGDEGETPEQTAQREAREETGGVAIDNDGPMQLLNSQTTPTGFVFHTFLQPVKDKFEPKLNGEHTKFSWAEPSKAPRPLHPEVQALFAGLGEDGMATDPPVSEAQRRAMWAAAKGRSTLGIPKKVGEEFVGDAALALDKDSVREYDADGRLHVASTNISKANVCDYLGSEIPGYEALGLDARRIYRLLRHPDELKKAADSFNGLPLMLRHEPTSAEDHRTEITIGATGTDAEFVAPYLRNSLVVWPQHAIDAIESEQQRELSCGYRYTPDMTPGTWEGEHYDGVMRDIVGNHVALVAKGRAGPDVVVGDQAFPEEKRMPKTRLGAYVYGRLSAFFKADTLPKPVSLALDTAVGALTAATLVEQKPKIKAALADIKGKLAKDVDLDGMHKFIDSLSKPAEDDPLLEDPNVLAVQKPTLDEEIENFRKGHSTMSAEDWKAYDALMERRAKDAAGPELKPGEEGKRTGEVKDEPPDFPGKPKPGGEMVGKDEMNKAIKQAQDAALTAAREEAAALRAAERKVRPWVGDLAIACDTAEQVLRAALKTLGVKNADNIHPGALDAILENIPKPSERPVASSASQFLTMDEAAVESFNKMFPGAARIGAAS